MNRFLHTNSLRPAGWRLALCLVLASFVCLGQLVPHGRADDEPQPAAPESSETPDESPQQTPAESSSTKFPLLEELEVPPAEVFLSSDPDVARDWIVLKSADDVPEQVIVALPVTPRPGTLAARQKALSEKSAERRGLQGDALERWKLEYDALKMLEITVPAFAPESEFLLPVDRIDRIIHHEDLWLKRIDLLIAEGNIDVALELLNAMEFARPDWAGLNSRADSLLRADARIRLEKQRPQEALMLLEELKRRNPDAGDIADIASDAVRAQVEAAIADSDYRQAKYFLDRLNALVPDTPLYRQYTRQLATRAQELMAQAKQAFDRLEYPRAAGLADAAARVWPQAQGISAMHKSIVERYQQVRVAVTRLPGQPTAYPFPDEAGLRHTRLTELPLFEIESFDNGAARYRTRFFDEWIPYDLGKTVRFVLRQTRQPWESQPVLLGWPITDRLRERLDPDHPRFDERLAGYVESMTVESPFEFTISFRRVPPRLEALLTDPIVKAPDMGTAPRPPVTSDQPLTPRTLQEAADTSTETGDGATGPSASVAGQVSVTVDEPSPLPEGAFQLIERTGRHAVYRRVFPEPERLRQYHVAEIHEILYENHEAALYGLMQGECTILPTPPLWIVRRVQSDENFVRDFFIQKHAIPETHVLQFNPNSKILKSKELRRGLLYGVNRRQILDDVFLRQENGEQGRVVPGPFPSNSNTYALGITPRPFDPYAGLALVFAATKQLAAHKIIEGELPVFRMFVPPEPLPRQAAEQIVRDWARLNIKVEIIPDDDLTAYAEDRWDIIYRRVQMTEPIVQLWPFLTLQNSAEIDRLQHIPDWLKQKIVALDRASDLLRAQQRAEELHRLMCLEATILPLWEVDQYSFYRKNLRGFPLRPVHCYDNVDSWIREASLQEVGLPIDVEPESDS